MAVSVGETKRRRQRLFLHGQNSHNHRGRRDEREPNQTATGGGRQLKREREHSLRIAKPKSFAGRDPPNAAGKVIYAPGQSRRSVRTEAQGWECWGCGPAAEATQTCGGEAPGAASYGWPEAWR